MCHVSLRLGTSTSWGPTTVVACANKEANETKFACNRDAMMCLSMLTFLSQRVHVRDAVKIISRVCLQDPNEMAGENGEKDKWIFRHGPVYLDASCLACACGDGSWRLWPLPRWASNVLLLCAIPVLE